MDGVRLLPVLSPSLQWVRILSSLHVVFYNSNMLILCIVTDALKTVVVAANGITNALKVLINLQTSVIVQARSSTGTARDTGKALTYLIN